MQGKSQPGSRLSLSGKPAEASRAIDQKPTTPSVASIMKSLIEDGRMRSLEERKARPLWTSPKPEP